MSKSLSFYLLVGFTVYRSFQGVAGCLPSSERMGRWRRLVGASLSRRLLLLDGDHVALRDVHRVRVTVRVGGILEKNFVILLCSYR